MIERATIWSTLNGISPECLGCIRFQDNRETRVNLVRVGALSLNKAVKKHTAEFDPCPGLNTNSTQASSDLSDRAGEIRTVMSVIGAGSAPDCRLPQTQHTDPYKNP